MRKLLLIGLMVILFLSFLAGEITFKGDARVRPRLDQKFNKNGRTYQDFYYLYWVRLWMEADLEAGWYFKTKLSTDGPGDYIGKFASPTFDGVSGWTAKHSAHSGHRGAVRFNEAHFGRKTDRMGFSIGLLNFNALANPEYDLHFYPVSRSDVPYFVMNTNSAAGFKGYYQIGPGRLNASITVDNNTGNRELIDERDQYSGFLNYEVQVGGVKVQPTLITSIGAQDKPVPITLGTNLTPPKFAGFSIQAGSYYTTQSADVKNSVINPGYVDLVDFSSSDSVNYTGKYSGPGFHLKLAQDLGPGTLVGWADYKSINMDQIDNNKNTTLIWLMYKYTVYKSDYGAFVLAPTFRHMRQSFGDKRYSRNKIELTMHFSFK